MLRAMRRCLLLLICLVLPVQLAWASAVGLCDHAPASDAAHCVQHDGADPMDAGSLDLESDCSHCQAHGAPLIGVLAVLGDTRLADVRVREDSSRPPAPPRARPERPNWSALA